MENKISLDKINELGEAAQPLMQWYHDNCDMHMHIIVDFDGVRVASDLCGIPIHSPIEENNEYER